MCAEPRQKMEGGSAITPLHTESVALSLSGNILSDAGDTDIGETAVDLTGWNPLEVTLVHRDALAVSPGDISAELLAAASGVLTVAILGRGGGSDLALTVNNLKWVSVDPSYGDGYTDFALRGLASWKKRTGTPADYTLVSTPLFTTA